MRAAMGMTALFVVVLGCNDDTRSGDESCRCGEVGETALSATPEDLLAGETACGLSGEEWGLITGTMPDNGAVTFVPTTTAQTIAVGYHNGAGTVEGDTDLVSGNVRSGVSLFGVSGDPNVVDTDSGDAAAGEILMSATAWVDGVEVIGTMTNNGAGSTITPTTTNQNIAAGYWSSINTVLGDADLDKWNIRSGVTIFGVTGTCYRLPATGQTTAFSLGDDGSYQLGCRPLVAPCSGGDGCNFNRTGLPWSSSWGITGFVDLGDGTVRDTLTGLIWLKDANCLGLRAWTQALSDANGLASGSCSLSDGSSAGDWRLPNINELRSLIDPGSTDPALPFGHPFTGVQSNIYWSSTTRASDMSYAWSLYLDDGYVLVSGKTLTFYVWPVRGG